LAAASAIPTADASVSPQASVGDWRDNLPGLDEAWLRGPRDPARWFTGAIPDACGEGQHVASLGLPDLSAATQGDLLAYFKNTWLVTEALFAGLQGEEPFYRPPYHDLRHPLIFYYGHAAVRVIW
jgi:hypothetical protein